MAALTEAYEVRLKDMYRRQLHSKISRLLRSLFMVLSDESTADPYTRMCVFIQGPTVLSQGPVVRASEPGIEASCARFSSVSSDPVGETHQPKKQSFTPQLSNEDFSDNNGGKRNGDPRSALPEGAETDTLNFSDIRRSPVLLFFFWDNA